MSVNPFAKALDMLSPGDPKPLHLKRAWDMHDMQRLLTREADRLKAVDGHVAALIALESAACFGDDALALAQEWCV